MTRPGWAGHWTDRVRVASPEQGSAGQDGTVQGCRAAQAKMRLFRGCRAGQVENWMSPGCRGGGGIQAQDRDSAAECPDNVRLSREFGPNRTLSGHSSRVGTEDDSTRWAGANSCWDGATELREFYFFAAATGLRSSLSCKANVAAPRAAASRGLAEGTTRTVCTPLARVRESSAFCAASR